LSSLTHVAAPAFPAGDPPVDAVPTAGSAMVSTPEPEPSPEGRRLLDEVFDLMED
jgi:hypothetical protein